MLCVTFECFTFAADLIFFTNLAGVMLKNIYWNGKFNNLWFLNQYLGTIEPTVMVVFYGTKNIKVTSKNWFYKNKE